MKLLVVEDSPRLRSTLEKGLRSEGFVVDSAGDGEEALLRCATMTYDAIVLDIMLPKVSGLDVLRRIRREDSSPPVLILSARDQTPHRIEGLQLGADDYLVKPFDFGELCARVRALIRRRYERRSPELRVGDLVIDTAARTVRISGETLDLTPSEYAVLECLAMRRGRVTGKAWLLDQLVGSDSDTASNVVEVYVSSLRRKLRAAGAQDPIRTRRGQGYLIP